MTLLWARRCCRCRTIDRRQVWKTLTEAQEARTEDQLPKAWYRLRRPTWTCPACGDETFIAVPLEPGSPHLQ